MTKSIILRLLFIASFLMQAQEPVSIHLSEKNGLPDKEFYNIIEDNKGFIWLCADKGLYRYDGKVYKKYVHALQRGLSVFGVQQDPLNRIWCNNISGQFFYLKDDKLVLFIDLKKQLRGELADFVVNDTYLWVFARSNIYRVNLKTKAIKSTLKSEGYLGIPFSYNNSIYYQSKDSISSITSGNTTKNLLATHLPNRTKNNITIAQGKSKIFNIGTDLFLMQNRAQFNSFFKIENAKKSLISVNGFEAVKTATIHTVFKTNDEIWIATSSGVWVYEHTANNFRLKKHLFKDISITKILLDKDNNYWFTSLNNGVYIIPNINIETSAISSENKHINSLDKVNDSILVYGLANGNIGLYNTHKHRNKIINLPTKDRVSALVYHPSNNIIISKDLSSYLLNINTLEHIKKAEYLSIKSFSVVDHGDLLCASYKTVRLIDRRNITLRNDRINKKRKNISDNKRTYTSFYNKTDKETYVAFVDGLVKYDSLWNSTIIQYKNTSIYGKSIAETSQGIVWIATFKNGVFGIKNDAVVHHYTTNNGLTSNNIEKIKADEDNLWIVTDNSIQALNVNTKQLKTLTKSEGVLSYDISGIEIINNKVYFSSSEGLFSVDKEKSFKTQNPEVYFNRVEINEKDTAIRSRYDLKYNQNAIKIGFNVNSFIYNQKGRYKYRLKGYNNKWLLTDVGVNTLNYNSLPAGDYSFQVQPYFENENKASTIKELHIVISSPFWKTWWFILGILLVVFGSIIIYFKKKIKTKEKERVIELEKISLEKELIAINLTALRSQMNPHFIFNALNSIQDLVLKQDTDASYDSIVLFAELIRNALSYSNQDFISIDKELQFLNVYLQLEKLRFGHDFKYTITSYSCDNLDIPSLLIQPFIENSLVHGLLHKSGNKALHVHFNFKNNVLECTITDNGVGRVKSKEIGYRQGNHHESFALGAIEKRLEIFKKQYDQDIGYKIEDLYKNKTSTGTKVTISMPFIKRF